MAEAFALTVTGTEELTRRLLELGEDAPKAAARAVNRTLSSLKTLASRGIAADLGLTRKFVDRSLRTQRATVAREIGTLSVGGYRDERDRLTPSGRIPLVAFGARGPEPSRGRGPGVRYRLPGGRGLATHAFLATMRSGHRGIFRRKGEAGRLPIGELYGPSPTRVFKNKILQDALVNAEATLAKNLDHEIGWILSQRVSAGDA